MLFSLDHIRKNLTADPIDTRVVAKRLISELSDIEKGNENFIGFIPNEAVKRVFFIKIWQINPLILPT